MKRWHCLVYLSEDYGCGVRWGIGTWDQRTYMGCTFLYGDKGANGFQKASEKTYAAAEKRAKAMQKSLNRKKIVKTKKTGR